MRLIKIAKQVIISNIALLLRLLLGCKVKFSFVNLISPFATLITEKKGRIIFGRKSSVRNGTEIKANGAIITLGSTCFINKNCMVIAMAGINIGKGTTIGPGSCIYDHDHGVDGGYVSKEISIGDNVWIG